RHRAECATVHITAVSATRRCEECTSKSRAGTAANRFAEHAAHESRVAQLGLAKRFRRCLRTWTNAMRLRVPGAFRGHPGATVVNPLAGAEPMGMIASIGLKMARISSPRDQSRSIPTRPLQH